MQIPAAAQWSPSFDVSGATQAWLDTISAAQQQQSNAYFEGGYWLLLWNLLWGLGVAALLLSGRRSARLRNWTERVTGHRGLQRMLYAAVFLVLIWLLSLPLSIYRDYFREHQYGLATQTFLPWFGEQCISLAVTIVLGAPFIALFYWVVRRAGNVWWAWGSGLLALFSLFVTVIEPVFIAPLFNDYTPLAQGPTRDSILSLARANGIPADDVYVFNASKQTTRISANVAGALGTTRIALNDNLLSQTSLPEIRAVMAHEMGHYVLHHEWRQTIDLSLLALLLLLVLHYGFDRVLPLLSARTGIRDRADIAGLPLALALLSILGFLAIPVVNTMVRTAESEADIFGLNAAREPQGFAQVSMRLSTYRKLEPGRLEELLLFDHPSGRTRVHMAMQWLKENPPAP
ncbi:MAG TPA: M48 family metalloprotease [Steroidobacteraceae bacterium]|jgi:STE24 endopeptidase|nr:M48 family metalloprotease [Steroidobacteraceae bacterium]